MHFTNKCSASVRKPKLFREIRDNAIEVVIRRLGQALEERKYSRKGSDVEIDSAISAAKMAIHMTQQSI